jgi:hypothetical protein
MSLGSFSGFLQPFVKPLVAKLGAGNKDERSWVDGLPTAHHADGAFIRHRAGPHLGGSNENALEAPSYTNPQID